MSSKGFLKALSSFTGSGKPEKLTADALSSLNSDPFFKPIDLKAECTVEDLRVGLLQFYICYAPLQLMQVPKLISKFRTIGKQALAETQKRFNQLPLPGEVHAVLATCRRTRLCVFYAFHAPEKIPLVDGILEHYVGHEDELWKALCDKYGPEREAHLLFHDWEAQEERDRQKELDLAAELRDKRQGVVFRRNSFCADGTNNDTFADILDRSIVVETHHLDGKTELWHRDPAQVARDLARRGNHDSPLDPELLSTSGHKGSFSDFSPLARVYPEAVVRRASSIMLQDGEAFSQRSTTDASSSPDSRMDIDEIELVLKCAKLDKESLCRSSSQFEGQLPPLPEDLSPSVKSNESASPHRFFNGSSPVLSPQAGDAKPQSSPPQPPPLSPSSFATENASFLSPRSRRRQTAVSFVLGNERDESTLRSPVAPHHNIELGQRPTGLLLSSSRRTERELSESQQQTRLASPTANGAASANQRLNAPMLPEDFDRL